MYPFLIFVLFCFHQPVIDDIDSILGTTEENKQTLVTSPAKSPQLHAPRPKEMQRILREHQQQMHAIEKDKKEIEEEKVKQRLVQEAQRSNQLQDKQQTGVGSVPPPTPVALSPVASNGGRSIEKDDLSSSYPHMTENGGEYTTVSVDRIRKATSDDETQMASPREDLEKQILSPFGSSQERSGHRKN